MFGNKKFKYGILRATDRYKYIFTSDGDKEKYQSERLTTVMNKLGEKGWELVQSDKVVGFLFKRVV